MGMLFVVAGVLLTGLLMIVLSFFVQTVWTRGRKSSVLGKDGHGHERNTGVLGGLMAVAMVYAGSLRCLHTLTGSPMLDGSIGLALGLYICSHPAANAINMLFFECDTLRQTSEWPLIRWLALNLLVLLAGWVVIFVGLRRLVDRAV
jgi:hypothetical protein